MASPLKEIRKSKGMTQAQMAELLGISRPAYTQIENGRRPSFRAAVDFSRQLGVSIEDLFLPEDVQNSTI